jgi:hypothetical protein
VALGCLSLGYRHALRWLWVALGGFVRPLDVGCWTLTALPAPTVFCRRFPGAAPGVPGVVCVILWGYLRRVFLGKYLLRAHLTWSGCRPAAGHAPKSPSRTRPLGLKRLILRGRGNLAPNRQVTQELLDLRLHAQPLLPYSHHVPASLSRISPMATLWLLVYQLSTLNHQLVGGDEPFPGSRRLCFSNIKPYFHDTILWTRHMARFILRP